MRKEAATINRIAHPVVTVSYPYRNYLENNIFSNTPLATRLGVVELGLDTCEFPASPHPPSGRALIYCGALEPRKNVSFMLAVFERVAATDPSASLTIVGNGPEAINLKTHAESRGLKVIFKGRLTHEQVISELLRHSIYLHTSVKESFSFSLLEAKLCGLTTCALAKLEVPAAFIDEGFDSFDVEEWATRILGIGNPPDLKNFPDFSSARMTNHTLQVAGWRDSHHSDPDKSVMERLT